MTCRCDSCAETLHASCCAVHNAPALPVGPCDCRAGERVIGVMDGWTITVPSLDAELARVDRTQRRETAED